MIDVIGAKSFFLKRASPQPRRTQAASSSTAATAGLRNSTLASPLVPSPRSVRRRCRPAIDGAIQTETYFLAPDGQETVRIVDKLSPISKAEYDEKLASLPKK